MIRDVLKRITPLRKAYALLMGLRPSSVVFRLNIKKVEIFDKRNGTNFGGRLYQNEIGTTKERANDYSPSPKDLIKLLKKSSIDKKDKIVDMGCGKGYAMFIMSKYGFGKVGGVELSSQLCNIANHNLVKMMPSELTWEVVCCDAGKWDGYDEYNYYYIYNSFPKIVMQEVKDRIKESIKHKPREINIWYLEPEFPEVFMNDDFFCLVYKDNFLKPRNGIWIFKCKGY